MKCPKCGGDGVITFNKTDKNGYFNDAFFVKECDECDGTGKVEMTNEYFLKTATTEQLAEFLCNVGFENQTIVRKFKSEWEKWLKEKHDGNT